VVEAAPAAAFVMADADFLFQIEIIALDAPAQFGEMDEAFKRDVFRGGREPVFGGFRLPLRPFNQEPFLRSWFSAIAIAMGGPDGDPRSTDAASKHAILFRRHALQSQVGDAPLTRLRGRRPIACGNDRKHAAQLTAEIQNVHL